MSRVIHTQSPAKIRNHNRRTIAEILRHLGQKPALDAETKDMAAMIVFLLREISVNVDSSAQAWEKRGYWMKAERFLRNWQWLDETAGNFEDVIRNDAWDLLPELMVDLYPRFADIQIKNLTRKADSWRGAYQKLMSQPPTPLSY